LFSSFTAGAVIALTLHSEIVAMRETFGLLKIGDVKKCHLLNLCIASIDAHDTAGSILAE